MYDKKEILAREMWDYLQSILRALTNSMVEKNKNLSDIFNIYSSLD